MEFIRRSDDALWRIGVLLFLVTIPLAPPRQLIDLGAGAVASVSAVVLGFFAVVWYAHHRDHSTVLFFARWTAGLGLLAFDFAAQPEGPYHELVILSILGMAISYSPQRVVVFTLAMCAGYVMVNASGEGVETIPQLGVWLLLPALVTPLIETMRQQRRGLEDQHARALELVHRDALTGAGNRRGFDAQLEAAVLVAQRDHTALTLFLGDLDGFKPINDTFGHPAGDQVLFQVAAALREELRRPADGCFRWGGDEFALIVPGAGATEAPTLADRLREAVARAARTPDGHPVSITLGYASLHPRQTPQQLIDDADRMLLAAKQTRRDTPRDPV